MFGLSLDHLLVLLVAGLFVLGPERLPESARWLAQAVHKVRGFASGAQAQLRSELGPEFQELRKPLQELQSLREFSPRTVVSRYLLDDDAPERPAAATPVAEARPLSPGERAPVDPDAT
ncbi:Sec-independent protein translocase TatB [Amycolatopsis sp. PS_44_ISF1]|uniref:Sec-independent protein translocase TatB n=1 Tax=Amycolatopsis sp. PS_44_ISF1 TaxID=2974917 RepID=UPI0028DF23A3|nr:Sec-independent protein translocase TatB [Amycolatopsis sp. PS_44_ISF1]MDT8915247.1 twin-arginine translocase TatA/TatE family subunit [Amycolatopsis sp. PS_44_ISF1]